MRLIHSIDCTSEFSSESYFSCGETRVCDTSCGRYREAAATPLARFGYRLRVKAGTAHLLRVRYPDDRRRFMMIGDGTSYDLSTAITTGGVWPLSGKMQQLEEIFWPRFADLSICFMTWGYEEAAAVAGFELFELDENELSPLELDHQPARRSFGVQYEDPCGIGASEGSRRFDEWLEHVITYLKHTGQNVFAYPLCWYHGPLMPVRGEQAGVFNIIVEEDRKQYIAWSDDPPEWPDQLLKRCDEEAIDFYAVTTLLRLDSLMRHPDAAAMQNRLWNNRLQTGTMDWTVVYHTGNFPSMLIDAEPFDLSRPRTFMFGEKAGDPEVPPGPIFNVLHPFVQERLIAFFREVAEKYREHASFKGFSVTMWAPTLLWFGSLRSGYDDWTAARFSADTGIELPGAPDDPGRFARRHEFLIHHCRELWIDWRCEQIARLIRRIRDAITAVRRDLRLSLTLWNEPFVPAVRGCHHREHQFGVRASMLELYREAGFDPALFRDEENIDFALQTEGGGRDRTPGNQRDMGEEAFHMFRDHDFLDMSVWDELRRLERPSVYVFNAWHEAWGRHRWFPAAPGEGSEALETYGKKAPFFRINSEYEKDGFWWDSQLRIAPASPPPPYYMEYFAHALAECDAVKLTAGGLFLDKTHTVQFRRFAAVYRSLPAHRFEDVPGCEDPVKARRWYAPEATYAYWVNRTAFSCRIHLRWSDGTEETFLLSAFELASRVKAAGVQLNSVECTPDADAMAGILAEARRKTAQLEAADPDAPGAFNRALAAEMLKEALSRQQPARLRHLLDSYPLCTFSS